jgi:hypothetical protein
MSLLAAIQQVVWPSQLSDATKAPYILGGAVLGYYFWAPYIGASEMGPALLAAWAFGRSASKLFLSEQAAYSASAAMVQPFLAGVAPLAVMYVAASQFGMGDLTNAGIVYGAYVAAAIGVQMALAPASSAPAS